jgi:general secretion pathway protein L
MAQLTLGVDISDDLLSAVVVTGKGKEGQVTACASAPLEEHADIPEVLPGLLEELHWQGGNCVLGLPLSYFSLRNLVLPFKNEKKIQQILPLELEEHLLSPVDEQIIATLVAGQDDAGTYLLTAALEKNTLRELLETFQSRNLDPDVVCPSSFCLANRLRSQGDCGRNFLLLYGDMGSMTMVICHEGEILFMRRLSYPEQVFTDVIFTLELEEGRVRVADRDAADKAVSGLCGVVQHSIDYFCFTRRLEIHPDHVILAGPMQLAEGFQEKIEHGLALPSKICDLAQAGLVGLDSSLRGSWQPAVYDRALTLAFQGGSRNAPLDFRKDEFVSKRFLLGSRRQTLWLALAAGLVFVLLSGYLFFDYRSLKSRHDSLAGEMTQVFKTSFPEVSRIVDPLVQMRSKLQEAQAPTVSMPLFTSEKRVLAILADISSRIPASLSMHVSRLVIDQDSVRIKGTTDAFNNVNTIKKLLAGSARFAEVNIVSATKTKEKNVIRFEIRLLLRETS